MLVLIVQMIFFFFLSNGAQIKTEKWILSIQYLVRGQISCDLIENVGILFK